MVAHPRPGQHKYFPLPPFSAPEKMSSFSFSQAALSENDSNTPVSGDEGTRGDDGLGSPIRQERYFRPTKATKPKLESKTKPKAAPKKPASSKISADAEAEAPVKTSKRARTMSTAAVKTDKKRKKTRLGGAIDDCQAALDSLEADELLVATLPEGDVEAFLTRTRSDYGFEVEDIDGSFPASPKLAPIRVSPPIPSWSLSCISERDRATPSAPNASLAMVETKLKGYYLVPYAMWFGAKKGTHTKYSVQLRYGTKAGDADFDDRRVVHAILEGSAPGGSGRMCNGWKSEKAPWARKEHSTLDFYLQKQDLPAGWQAPAAVAAGL